jgi:hypothetical protein
MRYRALLPSIPKSKAMEPRFPRESGEPEQATER